MTGTSLPKNIGPYEIARELGRGGMGVVYLGHDTKLDRPVAIKALTDEFAEDAERLTRFEREARVLASLSHGNIATLYGLEESDGHRYLVMEFVEGQTLAERLADGPLPMHEALSICAQIAAGVEAAHEAGIVHRDLKPANVIIRPDGTPKVLDFGLAREMSSRTNQTAIADAATVPQEENVTREGVAIGTPGYMSPEQVRGTMIDRRTDNFAFGCILYECLVGRLAFAGPTATDAIAAILHVEPDWKSLPENTPPTVHLLLRRCMHKDRRRRLRDIGDARIELEQAIDDPTSSVLGLAGAALGGGGRSRRTVLPWAVVACTILVALVAWWFTRPNSDPLPTARFAITIDEDHPLVGEPMLALSNDGQNLVFIGLGESFRHLFMRRFDQIEAEQLKGTQGASTPVFSPDGEWIAFVQNGHLRKMSVRGGPSETICAVGMTRGLDWGADGTIVIASDQATGLSRVFAAGGTPEAITTIDEGRAQSHRRPHILPGGAGVLFTHREIDGDWDDTSLWVLPGDGSTSRLLVSAATHGNYLPTGHLVFQRKQTILAAPFDLKTLELTGAAVPVLEGITLDGAGMPAQFTIADNGTLVFMTGSSDAKRMISLMNHDGVETRISEHVGDFEQARMSPDGHFVAIEVKDLDNVDIKILEIERDIIRPLTRDSADDGDPVWSPDGKWIAFSSTRGGGPPNVYRVRSDFTGTPERLTTSDKVQRPADWSPDGSSLLIWQVDPETDGDIVLLHLEKDGTAIGSPEPLVVHPGWQWIPRFSPDGQWMTYGSHESGRREIYARSVTGEGAAVQISTDGADLALWSKTDDRIVYFEEWRRPTTLMAVEFSIEANTLRPSLPTKLFDIGGRERIRTIEITEDDQLLFTHSGNKQLERREPIVVLNWFTELEAKMAEVPDGG